MAGGGATAIIGAVLGSEEMAAAGLTVVTIGLAQTHDGVAGVMTAFDGEERPTGFERAGGFFFGPDGAAAGRKISNFLSFSSALRGARKMAARQATGQDALDAMKGVKDGAKSDPCDCD